MSERTYDVEIERQLDIAKLAVITEAEADAGEDAGLEGNQQYRDIRGVTWPMVAEALQCEQALFQRFSKAYDLDEEAEAYWEECEDAVFPEDDLWGLDVGVAGAVLALSAMGAVTVSSCNAGGFGGRHVEAYPMIVAYVSREIAEQVLSIVEEADVGLDMRNGLVRVFGRTDYDLHRFGRVALNRAGSLSSPR